MTLNRLPFRDPRTVARDIPGVLDVLFPRLTGGLVSSLNRTMFSFENIKTISDDVINESKIQNSMLFEISVAHTESMLSGVKSPNWNDSLQTAVMRQRRHYDAKIPNYLEQRDLDVISHASTNLFEMLESIKKQHQGKTLEIRPAIPGLGWISSGVGDFCLESTLIEVKHTDRNFVSGDFRQVLIYWLLKYASSIENDSDAWSDCLLLNPRRNSALIFNFDSLLRSASNNSDRVELLELLRSIVNKDLDRR
ncbi:MAG: hypothetical protein KKC72_07495 [Alphaproteobacteria bacterium]|nr:hypothetical protein [Alphaproteobacteria bacterium]MBU1837109.1 hypothetical protein [Alphaproteobacteria bacterium]